MNDFDIKENGLVVREGWTPELWEAVGHQLATYERGYMWAIGDWLNAGERKEYMERGRYDEAAERFGLSKTSVRYAADIAKQFPKSARRRALSFEHHKEVHGRNDADELLDMGLTTKELREEKRRRDKPSVAELPDNQFTVIYADPPWEYGDKRTNDKNSGSAESQYPTMPLDAICQMPVNKAAYKNSVLFIWATAPCLPEAMTVINAWGFSYKAQFVWDKLKGFNGHYNDVRHELLLIATKGSCVPTVDTLTPSVIACKRTKHSKKPELFYDLIESMYASSSNKYLELFARNKRDNWTAWGNQS